MFQCARCHELGHVFKNYEKQQVKKVWKKKVRIASELGDVVPIVLAPISSLGKYIVDFDTGLFQKAKVPPSVPRKIVIGDLSIPLIEGSRPSFSRLQVEGRCC